MSSIQKVAFPSAKPDRKKTRELQILHLRRKYGLPPHMAALLAGLHFGGNSA